MTKTFLVVVLTISTFFNIASAQNAWRGNFEPGNFYDECDSTKPCNSAKNLVCSTSINQQGQGNPFRSGRCECKREAYTNIPWIFDQNLGYCVDSKLINQNPHQHYNPNQQFPPSYGNGNGNNGNGFGNGGSRTVIGGICVDDRQCQNDLREVSKCVQGRCQCFDTLSSGKSEVRERDGQCWLVLKQGEVCQADNECLLSDSNLRCTADSGNSNLRHCTCISGRTCGNSGTTTTTTITSITTLGLLALVALKIIL